jgi:hypothetical protein
MMFSRIALLFMTVVLLALGFGCGGGPAGFDDGMVKLLIGSNPVTLEAEQIVLSPTQFECGLRSDLWEAPRQLTSERSSAALTPNGKALNFEDEVMVKEAGYRHPYVQVRGKFTLRPTEVVSITDGPSGTKMAQAKVGVVVQHACFTTPLPLMGVRHGKFSQDSAPVFQFRLDGETWVLDKIRH